MHPTGKSTSTITVGIPAHNEAANIVGILHSILGQEGSFVLERIVVVCDGCTDRTAELARTVGDPRIEVVNDGHRTGKIGRLNELYAANRSDYLLTMDADVIFENPRGISDMLALSSGDENIQVVAPRILPVPPQSHTEKLFFVNEMLWDEIRCSVNRGDHIANLYGQCVLLRKAFAKTVKYPPGVTADQEYLYMVAKQTNGFRYVHSIHVLSRTVSTFADFRFRGTRMLNERYALIKYFGDAITVAHIIPFRTKVRGVLITFLRYPLITPLVFMMNIVLRIFPLKDPLNVDGQWQQVVSTKRPYSHIT